MANAGPNTNGSQVMYGRQAGLALGVACLLYLSSSIKCHVMSSLLSLPLPLPLIHYFPSCLAARLTFGRVGH